MATCSRWRLGAKVGCLWLFGASMGIQKSAETIVIVGALRGYLDRDRHRRRELGQRGPKGDQRQANDRLGNSGMEIPKPTTVSPTIIGEIPSLRARRDAPSTNSPRGKEATRPRMSGLDSGEGVTTALGPGSVGKFSRKVRWYRQTHPQQIRCGSCP